MLLGTKKLELIFVIGIIIFLSLLFLITRQHGFLLSSIINRDDGDSNIQLATRLRIRAEHLERQIALVEDTLLKNSNQQSAAIVPPPPNTNSQSTPPILITNYNTLSYVDLVNQRSLARKFNMRYWLDSKPQWSTSPLISKSNNNINKYVSFEPWPGGFNNIRMSLEMAAAFAYATQRTLVLPPKYNMYLRGVSSFEDYFDMDDLARGISVLSFEDFRKVMNLDALHPELDSILRGGYHGSTVHYFKAYERMPHGTVNIQSQDVWNGKIASELVFCVPKCPSSSSHDDAYSDKNVLDHFTRVSYRLKPKDIDVPEITNAKIVHFPANLLGHYYTFVWFLDPLKNRELRRTIRNHLHFREEIFTWAELIINALGGDFSYSCVHIRRNDFQFKEVWTPAEDIVKNIGTLFKQGKTIYIATDELSVSDKEKKNRWSDPAAITSVKEHTWFTPMFDAWGGRSNVKFWSDFHSKLGLDKIPKILIGCVESVVCARADVFVGTQKSTFSGYIHRMRGYMPDVEQKELLEAQAKFPTDYYRNLNGKPSWGTFPHGAYGGGHPYWGREYKEAWELDPV
jgi:hypothetical protein